MEKKCLYCNLEHSPEARFCQKCGRELSTGTPTVSASYERSVEQAGEAGDYLVWAILATIFCCLPFGIVAIVYAAQANAHRATGNYEAALQAAESAKNWCLASLFTGLAVYAIYFMVSCSGFVAGI